MDAYKKIIDEQKQILSEGKQVGVVYHFTTLNKAWLILDQGELRPKGAGGFSAQGGAFVIDRDRDWVSLTRNPHLKITAATGARSREGETWGEVRIAFDGDRLSNRHKIEPYHDDDGVLSRTDNQAEERVKGKVSIMGSIVGITFYYDLYMRDQCDFDNWSSPPDTEQRARYKAMARQDAVTFVKWCRSQEYPLVIERGIPVQAK